jgi:hypothetical protein
MASEKWDKIVARYQEIYLHSRYEENARGILNLIPLMKDNPAFADVIPTTSLTALCLEFPSKKTNILIWYESGEYSISVQGDSTLEQEWIKIGDENIIPVLQQHIQEISSK